MDSTTFGALAIGARFHLGRYGETRLVADLGQPGTRTYEKVSARRYRDIADGESLFLIGSTTARVWEVGG